MISGLGKQTTTEHEVMFRGSTLALAVLNLPSNQVTLVNAPFAALLRVDAQELLGLNFLSLVVAEARDIVQRVLTGVAVGLIDSCHGQGCLQSPHGDAFRVAGAIRALDAAPPHTRALVIAAPADEARPSEPRLMVDPTRTEVPADDRATRLEGHLWRIAAEVQAAGISDLPRSGPDWWSDPILRGLSGRQWDILRRLTRGERVPTIARQLFVSQSTVRNHLSAIYRKVGVHSQTELLTRIMPGAHSPVEYGMDERR